MRKAKIKRKTKETDISLELSIDGKGKADIKTGIGFLNHGLELFAKHGFFDLKLKAKGDLKVDIHHTNEDIGICLGLAFKKALGDMKGIKRFGFFYVPMEEALVRVVLDISGRPALFLRKNIKMPKSSGYGLKDLKHFLQSFVRNANITMHIDILQGDDSHHVIEAIFKVFAKAMDEATQIDKRSATVPSTKGIL
jgi:imidazoleglycerol-phosphate dehydratase